MQKKPGDSERSTKQEKNWFAAYGRNLLASHPFGFWFWGALVVLMPVYIWFVVQSDWLSKPPKPVGDGLCYESIGFSLSSGKGFVEDYQSPAWRALYETNPDYADLLERSEGRIVPATGRPPVLPVFIASTYLLLDRTPNAFMWIRFGLGGCLALSGAMAAAVAALLLYRVTSSIAASSLGATVAIGFAASQNTVKEYTTDFLTEPIALLWVQTLISLVVVRWFKMRDMAINSSSIPGANEKSTSGKRERASWKWAFLIGSCMGLSVLTRSMFIFWIPGILGVLFLIEQGSRSTRFAWVFMIGFACLITCMPWWVHNCVSLKRFMPLGTQGSVALLGGYSDEAYRDMGNWSYQPELAMRRAMKPRLSKMASETDREVAISLEASRKLKEWVFANMNKLPYLAVMRAVTHWNPYTGKSAIWKLFIVVGMIWVIQSCTSLRWWLLGLPVLSTLVVMGLYETGGRFLVPLYGHLFTLGGVSVGIMWTIFSKPSSKS